MENQGSAPIFLLLSPADFVELVVWVEEHCDRPIKDTDLGEDQRAEYARDG